MASQCGAALAAQSVGRPISAAVGATRCIPRGAQKRTRLLPIRTLRKAECRVPPDASERAEVVQRVVNRAMVSQEMNPALGNLCVDKYSLSWF